MGLPSFTGRVSACDIWNEVYLHYADDERVVALTQENLMQMARNGLLNIGGSAPAIMRNRKTGESFDCTTVCGNTLRGRPCDYCYVDASRQIGFSPLRICLDTTYSHEVLGWSKDKIRGFNEKQGGFRMFSFGDYIDTEGCNTKVEELSDDAELIGLKLKAHTKRPDFVEKYHDRVDNTNVSIDSVGMGVRWSKAKELKRKYPDKVKIRAVATDKEDFLKWVDRPWVDVITPYHGRLGERCANPGLYDREPELKQEIEERRAEGEEVRDNVCYENLRQINWLQEAAASQPGLERRICSLEKEKHCDDCLTKCGDDGCHDICVEWDV